MTRQRNFAAGLATGYTATLVGIVVGLGLTPFILRHVSREEYAIFALAGDALMWLSLLDFGLGAGLKARTAQLTGKTADPGELNRIASTAVLAQVLTSVAVLGAGALLVIGFPRWMELSGDLSRVATLMLLMLCAGAALSLSTQTFSSLLVAHQQVKADNLLRTALVLVRAGLTVALLLLGVGIFALPLASLAATTVTSVLAVRRAFRAIPSLEIRWKHASWPAFRSLAGLGVWFSLGSLAGIAIESLDRIVAGATVTLVSVTVLTLTGRLYALAATLLHQVTNTARPMLGQMLGEGRTGDAVRVYHRLFSLSTGSAVVAGAALWAGNAPFVRAWAGAVNYGGPALDLVLAANLVVHCWNLPNRAILASALVVRPQTLARVAEGVLNLALSLFLGARFGLVGVVAGTFAAAVLSSCWYLPLLTARTFGVGYRRLLWTDSSRLLPLALAVAPVAAGARWVGERLGGFPGAGAAMCITLAAGAALLWTVAFDEPLRAYIRRAARGTLPPWLVPQGA